jgi:hypothetical protein
MKEKEENEQQCNGDGDAATAEAQPRQSVALDQTRQEPKLAKEQLGHEIVDITGTDDERTSKGLMRKQVPS